MLAISAVPCSYADYDYLASLDYSQGPPGTYVQFSVSLPQYFDAAFAGSSYRTDSWENYVGKRYVLLWDMEVGDEYRPQYWNVIGSGYVNDLGNLRAQCTIPQAVAGHHSISAVYEYQDQYYSPWWKKEFIVTSSYGSGNQGNYYPTYSNPGYSATPYNGGGGYEDPDPLPGFESLLVVVAVGSAAYLKMGKRN